MAHSILDNCIGCGACARACPVHAIEGALKSRHAINAKRCIDCGVCGMSCPAGAVMDASGRVCARVPVKERRIPVIDGELCSACQICVTFCAAKALAISEPRARAGALGPGRGKDAGALPGMVRKTGNRPRRRERRALRLSHLG